MTVRPTVAIVTAAILGALCVPLTVGQDRTNPSGTYRWMAVVASIDTNTERASFRARATKPAVRTAEQLVPGQDVVLRWRGPTPGLGHEIASVSPLVSSAAPPKAATGRGHFAMKAQFVSVDRARRSISFMVPMSADSLDAVKNFASHGWLQVSSDIDRWGDVTAIVSIEPIRRSSAGQ